MRLDDELALSYYFPVADISPQHSVQLVQHTETGRFYVKKQMTIYNLEVMRSLQAQPVQNIPRIYVLAEDESGLTVIEDYMQGDTLQELLNRNGLLSEPQALDIMMQLCHIVAQLHHRDPPIVHRDIKPANLILSPDGVVKLLDLNAAKYADAAQSRDTRLLGTSGYAAPEQYGFGSSSVQTDLYALGVMMNVMMTGHIPSEQLADGKLTEMILKCTQLNPEDRYTDVDELSRELLSVRDGNTGSHAHERDSSWKRFLPPGFRTGSSLHEIIALIGYGMIFLLSFLLDFDTNSRLDLVANRIAILAVLLCPVFFSANYLGVQSQLPLSRSKNLPVRVLGIALYDVLMAVGVVLILVVIENFTAVW